MTANSAYNDHQWFSTPFALIGLCALLVAMPGCKQSKSASDITNNPDWEILTTQLDFADAELVFIEIRSKRDHVLNLVNPMVMNIEKWEDTEWIKVSLPYCPCLVNCPAPPDFIPIEARGKHQFSWNKKDRACANGNLTESAQESGEYRMIISYNSGSGSGTASLTIQFTI